jgi:RHS repeat-associated protein
VGRGALRDGRGAGDGLDVHRPAAVGSGTPRLGPGIYDYNARFYDATIGRFLSADTIVPDASDPQGYNRFSYVENRPTVFRDPSGHIKVCDEKCEEDLEKQEPIWEKLPVASPKAVQLYGATNFAKNRGRQKGYNTFAQGGHSGIDFVADPGTPVRAGVSGKVIKSCSKCFFDPGQVVIQVKDKQILYGHLGNRQVKNGDIVTPDTVLGYIEDTEEHTHIEIRAQGYDRDGSGGRLIGDAVLPNPLPYFNPDDQRQILAIAALQVAANTNKSLAAFYKRDGIDPQRDPWQDPYRQPFLLHRAGDIFAK